MKLKDVGGESVHPITGEVGSWSMVDGRAVYVNYFDGRRIRHTREDGVTEDYIVSDEPSLTQQQFRDQCDINHIMKNFADTGCITHLNRRPGAFSDFSTFPKDLRQIYERLGDAQDTFDQLPAKVRTEFGNDPLKFVEFCMNPANEARAIELGLADAVNSTTINDDGKAKASTKAKSSKPAGSSSADTTSAE